MGNLRRLSFFRQISGRKGIGDSVSDCTQGCKLLVQIQIVNGRLVRLGLGEVSSTASKRLCSNVQIEIEPILSRAKFC